MKAIHKNRPPTGIPTATSAQTIRLSENAGSSPRVWFAFLIAFAFTARNRLFADI